jgi:starvation-inducible DNA-binding protein
MDMKDARDGEVPPVTAAIGTNALRNICGALNGLLADMFALYVKTKNFHWHVSGPHFRDYHLLLDHQAGQIYAATDPIAERARILTTTGADSVRADKQRSVSWKRF